MSSSRLIRFEKMVAAGNDFIVIDDRANRLGAAAKRTAKRLCDRKYGVGADGLLLLGASKKADIKMRIINPDGSEADMCGNGVRCLSKFAAKRGLAGKVHTVETGAGVIRSTVSGSLVKSRLTAPKDLRKPILLRAGVRHERIYFVNTGVPHAVIFEKALEGCDVFGRGRLVRRHKHFSPKGTNVNFVKLNGAGIAVRTYERGVEAETLACGTGSTASALVSAVRFGLRSPVRVRTTGGEVLKVYFSRQGQGFGEVFLEGPVQATFEGSVSL